jgi:hypothetical protein
LASINPGLLKNSPALEALIGFLPKGEEEKAIELPAEVLSGTVTAKPKSENTEPEAARLVLVLKKLRRYFSEIEFEQCLEMLASIKDHKEFIQPTINYVSNHIERKLAWIKSEQEKIEKRNEPEQDATEQNENTDPENKIEPPEIGETKTTREQSQGANEPYEDEERGIDWQ